MMLVSSISYIDRNALAVLIPTIQRDTGMTGREYGWIVAAFSYAYMAGNPLWGMLLDRFGVRRGMLAAVGAWTVASALHGFAGGFWSFAVLRTALGFCEGATFPGALRTVMQTLSTERRSRGIALSYSGGSLGAILTPFLVTPIAVAYGWRTAFWCTGLAGLAWLLWWAMMSRSPELALRPAVERGTPLVWHDRRVWAFIAVYALGAVPLGFILYMSSLYLTRVFGATQADLGRLLWIPPAGWEAGYFFWGWWIDRGVKQGRGMHASCRGAFQWGILLGLPLVALPFVASLGWFMAGLFLVMFTCGAFIVGGIAYATHAFGNGRAGLIAGLGAGSFSAMTALNAPIFGQLFDEQRYAQAFWLAAAFPLLGFLLWLWFRGAPESSADAATQPAET